MDNSIHHVEIGITGGPDTVKKFTSKFPFRLVAQRQGVGVFQWLTCCISNPNIRFLFTQVNCHREICSDPYAILHNMPSDTKATDDQSKSNHNHPEDTHENEHISQKSYDSSVHKKLNTKPVIQDSVFNIALEVVDVQTLYSKLVTNGVLVIKQPTVLSDENGHVNFFMVKSIVGNVVHTIINSQNYNGLFLPGFDAVPESDSHCYSDIVDENVSFIDHFTFASEVGSSSDIIEWYENHFQMKRFFINRQESESDGFVVKEHDVGLRMKALEYWKCAETGLQSSGDCPMKSFKIVIAEALQGQGPNQIDTFLSEHGGPGIQHIGLHTSNIGQTIQNLKHCGVEFAEPPATYYSEVGRLHDIIGVGQDVQELKNLGILIDTEESDDSPHSQVPRYLLQKFTKPLFDKKTFFLELIQRIGATGFGSGNISALWRSVQAYMNEKTSSSS